ncbi:hypothetical protein CBL_05860 [Carabus blaptoides fortunei]
MATEASVPSLSVKTVINISTAALWCSAPGYGSWPDGHLAHHQPSARHSNSKWYRLSEKHMKRFVVVPRDLTGADSRMSRAAGHPLRPASSLHHLQRSFSLSQRLLQFLMHITGSRRDKPVCCPR